MSESMRVWRETAEAWKARCEVLEAENKRLKEAGNAAADAPALDDEVEAVIARYSFGKPGVAAAHRTYARAQIAAGALPAAVAATIRAGAYTMEGE